MAQEFYFAVHFSFEMDQVQKNSCEQFFFFQTYLTHIFTQNKIGGKRNSRGIKKDMDT